MRIFESGRTKIAQGEIAVGLGTTRPMPALALQIVPHTQAPWMTSSLSFGIGPVLRALEIVEALPARLRAAERLPVELDIEPFGFEEAFLMGDEVVEPHALGRDFDVTQRGGRGHGVSPGIDRRG